MKEITAIIQPHMLGSVLEALRGLSHFPGVTVSDCHGLGQGRGPGGHFEATEETIFFAKQVKLEVICEDQFADALATLIQQAAHTGNSGDGIILVTTLSHVLRVRTGVQTDDAC